MTDWGAWEGSGNRMRVGINVSWEAIDHNETGATATVTYYTQNTFAWSDDQTLNMGGAISGSVAFHNGQADGVVTQRAQRTYTYTYGSGSYGSSPGSKTFSASVSGTYNGITPSNSVTSNIPKRPYDNPAPVTNCNVSRVSDETNKVTWTNKDTAGEPYDAVLVDRRVFGYGTYNGSGGEYTRQLNGSGGAQSYTDTGITPNRRAKYRVLSQNSVGNASGWVYTDDIWTAPATPSGIVRNQLSTTSQQINWNNNTNYAEFETELWHAANGVWDSSPLAIIGPSSTTSTYTHDATHPAGGPGPVATQTHQYRVRARTTANSPRLYSSYTSSTSVSSGSTYAPNLPTNLDPDNAQIEDPTDVIVLSWQFNAGADKAKQTAFDVQYRTAGVGNWTTVHKTTSVASYTIVPSPQLPYSTNYEWQVQTYGADAAKPSGYTTSALFRTMDAQPKKYPVLLDLTSGRLEASSTGSLGGGGSSGTAAPVTHRRTTATSQDILTTTLITYETPQENIGGITYAAGLWTIPSDGTYMLAMGMQYVADSGGSRRVAIIQVNNATVAQQDMASGTSNIGPNAATTKQLSAGDVVRFCGWQNKSTAVSTTNTPPSNWASITKMDGVLGPQGIQGPTGSTGATGPPGPQGNTGLQGATGIQGPSGPVGNTGAQGPIGNTGPQGPIGNTGATGSTGSAGTPGEKWFTQAGAPAGATGAIADWSLDSANGDFYEKTGASAWTLRGNLRGPQGIQGATGTAGATGSQGPIGNTGPQGAQGTTGAQGIQGPTGQAEGWYSGSGAPTGGLGAVGDWYLDTTSGFVYEKTGASAWTQRASIMGPQGIQGPQGVKGDTGSTGAQGPPGSGGGSSMAIVDETTTVVPVATQMTFRGVGVTATLGSAGEAIVTVPSLPAGAAGGDLSGTYPNPTVPALATKVNTSDKGALNGVATLDATGKVPIAQVPTGTTGTTVPLGNDARLSDARTPTAHTHVKANITDLGTVGTAAAKDVPSSGDASTAQVVMGNDTRLTNSRAPTAHSHAIADIPVAASGTSNTTQVVRADDSRLSDARTPTAHNHVKANITDFAHSHLIADLPVAPSGTNNTTTVVRADDSRLSDSRTPVAHQHPASDVSSGVLPVDRLGSPVGAGTYLKGGTTGTTGTWTSVISMKADLGVGQASGIASLDASTLVPIGQLPTGTTSSTVSLGNHAHTPAQVGLDQVNNTSDANKPVSTAQQTAINTAQNGAVSLAAPPGSMTMYVAPTAPTGYLLCDGSSYSQTTYAALYAVIGRQFTPSTVGAGLFCVPDMQGRFPLGVNPGVSDASMGAAGRNETQQGTQGPGATQQNRNDRLDHNHVHSTGPVTAGTGGAGHTHEFGANGATNTTTGGTAPRIVSVGGSQSPNFANGVTTTTGSSHTHTVTGNTDPAGVAGSNTSNHALLTLYFIIKT